MMQAYKVGMESGYQPSKIMLALSYLSYLNHLVLERDKQAFIPIYGLNEGSLIQVLRTGIESGSLDAIDNYDSFAVIL